MKSKKYMVYMVVVILIVCVGVTYAYYKDEIIGSRKHLSISSKEIRILFTDDMTLASNDITPGWSEAKTFSVKNESKEIFNYNIVLKGLVNTFETVGFLQYKITSSNGYNMEGYINIPKSETAKDITVAYDIDIDPGITQEYKIEFIYHNSETVDQSEDMGKTFTGTLAIVEGSIDPNKYYSVTLDMLEEAGVIDNKTQTTLKNGTLEYNISLNEGYTLEEARVVCDNGAVGSINNNKVTISNITKDNICTITPDKKIYDVRLTVVNGKSDALNRLVEHGKSAEFNITPNTGYTMTNASISGGCRIEGNKVILDNVISDKECELTLVKEKYNVTLTGSNVSVENSPQIVEYLGSTTFRVTANTGYTLDNSVVNCDNGAESILNNGVVTVNNIVSNTTCTITPKQLTYEVTLVVENGTGNTTKTVAHAGSETFNISANTGHTTENPEIRCTGSAVGSINGSVVTISNVTTTQTCTVTLQKKTYTVSVTSNNNTYGTVSPTSVVVSHGNNATITISPKTGYKYLSNTCGGTVSGSTLTITNVQENKTCTVTFTPIQYRVDVTVTNGTSNPTYKDINYKGSGTFTIIPNSGYTLTSATVNCTNNQTGSISAREEVTISNITSNATCTVTLKEDITNSKYLYGKLLADHPTRLTRTDFNNVLTIDNIKTLYSVSGNWTENGKIVYYFAGNALDNWIKFGKDSNGNDLYWRIIRTNEDGSVRLLYVGTSIDTTEGYINIGQAYNSSYNNPMYVGYMYGTSGSLANNRRNTNSSLIKNVIDRWYLGSINAKTDALENTYDKYVSRTAIYCNDRANEGYTTGSTLVSYAGYKRLVDTKHPSYKCGNNSSGSLYTGTNGADNADRFSASTNATYTNGVSAGNGKLQCPVAMMTADEIVFAGGKYDTISQAWYYYNSARESVVGGRVWWLMSPYRFSDSSFVFKVYGSNGPGGLISSGVNGANTVRPVLSLKSCTTWISGDGSVYSPYEVSIDSACASRDN